MIVVVGGTEGVEMILDAAGLGARATVGGGGAGVREVVNMYIVSGFQLCRAGSRQMVLV